MSEYQYYEFAAIDRPLTRAEMAALRAVSTRAVITPTGFTNHYEWGNLKADPADWMQRYFDAFVYTANWCSRWLSLRVPLDTFSKGALNPFALRRSLAYKATKTHWIIDWALDESEDYDGFAEDEGSGWMRRLMPLRDELLRGDLRPLYLGWLAGAHALRDDALEPEVPPGLAELSPAQQALAEFLEIDPDLLEAAGAGNAPKQPAGGEEAERIGVWLDPDKHWKKAHAHTVRGVASGYDQAARTIAELAEGYALVSSRKAFDGELRQFLIPHGKRAALLRRLADGGLLSAAGDLAST